MHFSATLIIIIHLFFISAQFVICDLCAFLSLSFLQGLGISKVGPVRQIPLAIEVLHEVLYYCPFYTENQGSSTPLLFSSPLTAKPGGLTKVWGRKGKLQFPQMPFPPCFPTSLSFLLLTGRIFFFLFLWIFLKEPVFALRCSTTGGLHLVLFTCLSELELGGGLDWTWLAATLRTWEVRNDSVFRRKKCVYVVLSMHVVCSHLILVVC